MRSARHKYYSRSVKKLKESNPSRWWKEVKSIGGLSNENTWFHQLISEDNPTCQHLADSYNNFLVELTSHFNPLSSTNDLPHLDVPSEFFVDACQVYKELQKIKVSKSPGPDQIPNKIVKLFAFELAAVIADICNASIVQGVFPSQLKRSIIRPIPKVSLPTSIEDDLRPISLTSQISKVMEGFMLNNLFSQVANKLDAKQFAQPKKSTTHALVYLLHLILAGLDNGHCSVRLFFADFKKGFDLVDHNVIVQELFNLDVHPILIQWIKAFLTDREQCVKIDLYQSSWRKTNGGLPQGTRLGPLLFSILVNPLLNDWQGRIKFVDDATALEIIPRCSPSLMPMVVDEIYDFAQRRGMMLNPKKCKEMVVSFLKYKFPCDNPIFISGCPVESVSSFKLLGVLLSDDLTWSSHVDYVLKKANSRLYALRLLKRAGLSPIDLTSTYSSFIRSRIEYASPAWSALPISLSNLLESIQKRALRIIFPYLSYDDALTISGLAILSSRRENSCKKFMVSLRANRSPCNPLTDIIKERLLDCVHVYNLRVTSSNFVSANTERFRNFITVKYY